MRSAYVQPSNDNLLPTPALTGKLGRVRNEEHMCIMILGPLLNLCEHLADGICLTPSTHVDVVIGVDDQYATAVPQNALRGLAEYGVDVHSSTATAVHEHEGVLHDLSSKLHLFLGHAVDALVRKERAVNHLLCELCIVVVGWLLKATENCFPVMTLGQVNADLVNQIRLTGCRKARHYRKHTGRHLHVLIQGG